MGKAVGITRDAEEGGECVAIVHVKSEIGTDPEAMLVVFFDV